MEFKRSAYVQELRLRMHNGLVKVITGMRRSGKSYLLFKLFYDDLLKSGVTEDHILTYTMEGAENKQYREPEFLLSDVRSKIKDRGCYYLFFDEVQLLKDFEEVLNSLLHVSNADIYVTGSNSRFLSKDVITEFRGRGDEIHVYPLTFREFMENDPHRSPGAAWNEFITYGGLPMVAGAATDRQKNSYLLALFKETWLKDIIEHNRTRKTQELEDLIKVLASSIGALTSPRKLLATFKSEYGSALSVNTVKQYLDFLTDAFLVNPAQRYDVKGRRYIGSPVKYYFEDLGVRNACLDFRQYEESQLMENALYNELKCRGYNVDVGAVEQHERGADGRRHLKTLEVDFVANLGSRRIYFQSALSMSDEDKLRQEKASLKAISDSFQKIIIVKDEIKPRYDDDGILTVGLFDFLLNPRDAF